LADASILTSLIAIRPDQFSWNGEKQVRNIDVKNSENGKCAGVLSLELMAVPCEEKRHFMCEASSKQETTAPPSSK
jgi:hypothetical protein